MSEERALRDRLEALQARLAKERGRADERIRILEDELGDARVALVEAQERAREVIQRERALLLQLEMAKGGRVEKADFGPHYLVALAQVPADAELEPRSHTGGSQHSADSERPSSAKHARVLQQLLRSRIRAGHGILA